MLTILQKNLDDCRNWQFLLFTEFSSSRKYNEMQSTLMIIRH